MVLGCYTAIFTSHVPFIPLEHQRSSPFDLCDLSVSHDLDNAVSVFAIIAHAFCLFHYAFVAAFRKALKQWVDIKITSKGQMGECKDKIHRNKLINAYNI